MLRKLLLLAATALVSANAAEAATPAFGFTKTSSRYVINTGAGLTINMLPTTCDIVSLLYKNQELQYKAKYTQVNSGLGSLQSTITQLADAKKTIQVTCTATGITQYYFFRPNENTIYMGTYHTSDLNIPELRFLARLDRKTVATGLEQSTLDGTLGAIEAHDVYATSKNVTRSKFYSGVQFVDDKIHGVRGTSAGVYFVLSDAAYETSSGGPFHRDINNQCTTANELTFYMNSDHTRTDEYRYGFHGPYALTFTDGPAPSSVSVADFTFFQSLSNIKGFVKDAQRGKVTGTISDAKGVLTGSPVYVTYENANAQYWSSLGSSTLKFASPPMKEGTYTVTVYKKQLAVGTGSVTVKTGATTTFNPQVTYVANANPIWRIGAWDGTPEGFLNADKIHTMHPSDMRMTTWKPSTFRVGTDKDAAFPMALFRKANDPTAITFTLTAARAKAPRTLQIGVSLAQLSARPSIKVNDKWTGPVLASVAVKTRGVTRGVTHGSYMLYKYTIPASALVAGANKIAISIASGATDPAEKFLSASVVFDALELS
ncbi:Polysaccharide lyase, partial [Globisporangium splendens]